MANSLLDFVMSLVRDPDAAARYAADPAQALAAANLTDVSSVDVQNLLPVVSESLSMTYPTPDAFGTVGALESVDADDLGNIWTSGAATAAFDAFGDHIPSPVIDAEPDVPGIVDETDPAFDAPTTLDMAEPVASLQLDDLIVDTLPDSTGLDADWARPVVDSDPGDSASVFDLFD